jgi:hypothetical protein
MCLQGREDRIIVYPGELFPHASLPDVEKCSSQEGTQQPTNSTNTHQTTTDDEHRIQTSHLSANVLNLELGESRDSNTDTGSTAESRGAKVDEATGTAELEELIPCELWCLRLCGSGRGRSSG